MRIDRTCGSIKTGIGNAVGADAAVIICDIFYHPIDRVVGVGRFVDLGFIGVSDVGPHIFEFALAHPASTYILINKYIAFLCKQRIGTNACFKFIGSVRPDGIRRAVEQYRVFLRRVLGLVNRSKQLHAIPHRHHDLAFGVIICNIFRQLSRGRRRSLAE